jgi:transcriptional regulator GlxA family with amidase domain
VELNTGATEPENCTDARARFQQFLHQVPEAELQDCSNTELAGLLRCSPRHLSRLFREELGTSLRARQTELRLLKARQLLADSTAKVINVALDSGYRHLGLFNAMFKKRFGMTPTEWRRLNAKKARPRRTADLTRRLNAALLMLGAFVCGGARAQEQTPPAKV